MWRLIIGLLGMSLMIPTSAWALQFIQGHLPPAVARQQAIGRVPATSEMDLIFALPLRNRQDLTNLLSDIYRPGSPSFRHYLTPQEFADRFGPTKADYQSVIDFAKSHGLKVTGTHPNHTLLDVHGAVGDIERALHVHMNYYQHPTENRLFYAPDSQPSIDLATRVLEISGLHNYMLPHPCVHQSAALASGQPQSGSGPNGYYLGGDFRAAYAAGVSLNGAGQTVGLFELDGYDVSDITNYEGLANITPDVPLQTVLVDGFSGARDGTLDDVEVCLDIEMAISMAPGLSNVLVYEGPQTSDIVFNDILNRMATDDAARQISSSWLFDIGATTDQILQQFAAQGQSFFQASGDDNAYTGPILEPADDPNVTSVGGTFLDTTGPSGSWVSESVWNDGNAGSGGGISTTVPIPFWQQGINMSANDGSTVFRNLPDVAMTGYGVWVQVTNQSGEYQGTSIAAPLWAGFAALVNQQASLNGQPPLGFANPAIYAIGRSTNYGACFHDITVGNNTSSRSPSNFYAVTGYDLCTGWGTPIGSNLIDALLTPADALVITPEVGFDAIGPVGGPFSMSSQNYWLTNAGNAPLNWSLSVTSPWLDASATNGTLLPGGPGMTVTVSLNAAASNLLLGDFNATIAFTDSQDGAVASLPVALYSGNGGFETGDFTDWTLNGEQDVTFVAFLDDSEFAGAAFGDVTYSEFVHSGLCGAFLGQNTSLGYLSQTLPTVASNYYLLSCWFSSLDNDGMTTPNEFQVQWNGTTLFDQTNMGAFGWTNLEYIVTATGSATVLQFGFRDDPAALALDDITLEAVPTPAFQSVNQSNGTVSFSWNALAGLVYQLQYTTNLAATNWANLGPSITAATNVITTMDTNPPDARRFYRFVVSP